MRPLPLAALVALSLAAVPVAAGQGIKTTPDPGITNGSEQRALSGARKQWKAQGVSSYAYRLSVNCYCPPTTDVRIVVRNGRPAPYTSKKLLAQATVPRLFFTIQQAINDKVAKLVVKYGKRGVPQSIFIDGSQRVADDEIGYIIRGFAPLKG